MSKPGKGTSCEACVRVMSSGRPNEAGRWICDQCWSQEDHLREEYPQLFEVVTSLEDFDDHDIDNAERFALLCGDQIRYVHAWGKWLVWDRTRWVRDYKDAAILETAKEVPRTLAVTAAEDPIRHKGLLKSAGILTAKGKLKSMVEMTRGIQGVKIDHNELDADPWVLGTPNGWVDLRTGSFHSPDASKLITMATRAEWDPNAEAPLWEKSLEEWMPDPELRDYFQRLCGASIVGKIRDHLLVFVYGRGGNGKGTAFGAIGYVLGDYFTVPHRSLLISQKHEPHDTVKASLFRTRMAVAAESDSRVRLNEASIKELTGGDLLRARRLYEDEWSFEPTHTVWLQTNHLPEVSGTDLGIWRRIKVVPWEATFTGSNEDRQLGEKLEAEASGILKWLIDGALRWQEIGLGDDTMPEVVVKATDSYRSHEDAVARWMSDAGLALQEELSVEAARMQESWARWVETEAAGHRSFREVTQWLEAAGARKSTSRRQHAGERRQVTTWHGVGWVEWSDDAPF